MRSYFLNTALAGVLLFVTLGAKAGLIYDFDVSDTSWANSVIGDFTNASVFVEFDVNTDFNNLTLTDITSMGFNTVYGSVSSLNVFATTTILSSFFKKVNDDVYLTVGYTGIHEAITSQEPLSTLQFGQGGLANLYISNHGKQTMSANTFSIITKEFKGVLRAVAPVPEPSTLAIFALGLTGLASRRFKKQS
jgi:hypothetical protein